MRPKTGLVLLVLLVVGTTIHGEEGPNVQGGVEVVVELDGTGSSEEEYIAVTKEELKAIENADKITVNLQHKDQSDSDGTELRMSSSENDVQDKSNNVQKSVKSSDGDDNKTPDAAEDSDQGEGQVEVDEVRKPVAEMHYKSGHSGEGFGFADEPSENKVEDKDAKTGFVNYRFGPNRRFSSQESSAGGRGLRGFNKRVKASRYGSRSSGSAGSSFGSSGSRFGRKNQRGAYTVINLPSPAAAPTPAVRQTHSYSPSSPPSSYSALLGSSSSPTPAIVSSYSLLPVSAPSPRVFIPPPSSSPTSYSILSLPKVPKAGTLPSAPPNRTPASYTIVPVAAPGSSPTPSNANVGKPGVILINSLAKPSPGIYGESSKKPLIWVPNDALDLPRPGGYGGSMPVEPPLPGGLPNPGGGLPGSPVVLPFATGQKGTASTKKIIITFDNGDSNSRPSGSDGSGFSGYSGSSSGSSSGYSGSSSGSSMGYSGSSSGSSMGYSGSSSGSSSGPSSGYSGSSSGSSSGYSGSSSGSSSEYYGPSSGSDGSSFGFSSLYAGSSPASGNSGSGYQGSDGGYSSSYSDSSGSSVSSGSSSSGGYGGNSQYLPQPLSYGAGNSYSSSSSGQNAWAADAGDQSSQPSGYNSQGNPWFSTSSGGQGTSSSGQSSNKPWYGPASSSNGQSSSNTQNSRKPWYGSSSSSDGQSGGQAFGKPWYHAASQVSQSAPSTNGAFPSPYYGSSSSQNGQSSSSTQSAKPWYGASSSSNAQSSSSNGDSFTKPWFLSSSSQDSQKPSPSGYQPSDNPWLVKDSAGTNGDGQSGVVINLNAGGASVQSAGALKPRYPGPHSGQQGGGSGSSGGSRKSIVITFVDEPQAPTPAPSPSPSPLFAYYGGVAREGQEDGDSDIVEREEAPVGEEQFHEEQVVAFEVHDLEPPVQAFIPIEDQPKPEMFQQQANGRIPAEFDAFEGFQQFPEQYQEQIEIHPVAIPVPNQEEFRHVDRNSPKQNAPPPYQLLNKPPMDEPKIETLYLFEGHELPVNNLHREIGQSYDKIFHNGLVGQGGKKKEMRNIQTKIHLESNQNPKRDGPIKRDQKRQDLPMRQARPSRPFSQNPEQHKNERFQPMEPIFQDRLKPQPGKTQDRQPFQEPNRFKNQRNNQNFNRQGQSKKFGHFQNKRNRNSPRQTGQKTIPIQPKPTAPPPTNQQRFSNQNMKTMNHQRINQRQGSKNYQTITTASNYNQFNNQNHRSVTEPPQRINRNRYNQNQVFSQQKVASGGQRQPARRRHVGPPAPLLPGVKNINMDKFYDRLEREREVAKKQFQRERRQYTIPL